MSQKCTATVQMLNDVISIYSFTKVALLLCCCYLQKRFIVLLPWFFPWSQFFPIEQDLLVMAQGVFGDCHLYQMYQIVCCALLYYCVVAFFFLSLHCGFHLSFGTHNQCQHFD